MVNDIRYIYSQMIRIWKNNVNILEESYYEVGVYFREKICSERSV